MSHASYDLRIRKPEFNLHCIKPKSKKLFIFQHLFYTISTRSIVKKATIQEILLWCFGEEQGEDRSGKELRIPINIYLYPQQSFVYEDKTMRNAYHTQCYLKTYGT